MRGLSGGMGADGAGGAQSSLQIGSPPESRAMQPSQEFASKCGMRSLSASSLPPTVSHPENSPDAIVVLQIASAAGGERPPSSSAIGPSARPSSASDPRYSSASRIRSSPAVNGSDRASVGEAWANGGSAPRMIRERYPSAGGSAKFDEG